MRAISEMERANCCYHKEYLECERCGSDTELDWRMNVDEWTPDGIHVRPKYVDWDWACSCNRCGHSAYLSKEAGKLEDIDA